MKRASGALGRVLRVGGWMGRLCYTDVEIENEILLGKVRCALPVLGTTSPRLPGMTIKPTLYRYISLVSSDNFGLFVTDR